MHRRGFLAGSLAGLAMPTRPLHAAADAASLFDTALARAAQPHVPDTAPLPPPFADLTYDAYRGIRPRKGKAAHLPLGKGFAVDLLPPGLYFPEPVRIDRMTPQGPAPYAFSPDHFDFAPRYFDDLPGMAPGAGYSGLRLRYPLNAPHVLDEVMVVQGASYFRAVGRGLIYGLSARAIALGTGAPGPEEFPRFSELRLHEAKAGRLRIEGVVDSPSLAAHVEMVLHPGATTTLDITVTVLPRVPVRDIGIAPLTSMYLKGPLRAAVSDDFRPRVHDSDVLLIENGAGEWLWRPIDNPARIETSAFQDKGPRSFALLQTPRRFVDFQDTEARYHERPSARVTPRDDWGRGAVMLVEIPTGDEFMDNIVAFWRPESPLAPGGRYRFAYRLDWAHGFAAPPGRAIRQSRSGREHDQPGTRRFVVDFDGPPEGIAPHITATAGASVHGQSLFALPNGSGTRVTFLLTPKAATSSELRLQLRTTDGSAASPVWLHRWTAARDGGV